VTDYPFHVVEYAIRYCMTRETSALYDGFDLTEAHWEHLSTATRSDVLTRLRSLGHGRVRLAIHGGAYRWPIIAHAAGDS